MRVGLGEEGGGDREWVGNETKEQELPHGRQPFAVLFKNMAC